MARLLRPQLRAALAALAVCTGCDAALGPLPDDGVPRIDGRSEASFAATCRRIKDALTNRQQAEFADACLLVSRDACAAAARRGDGDAVQRALRERLHGMSFAELTAAAAAVRTGG
ncbi:MAG: hypothetical protein AB7O97_06415 [Planctomycetota bacterium]